MISFQISFILAFYFTNYHISAQIEDSNSRWLKDAVKNLKDNLPGKCSINFNDSIASSLTSRYPYDLAVSFHFPSREEVKSYREKPTTISKGNSKLLGILNTSRVIKWAADTKERWMVAPDHPGQNRKLCINLTRTIGLGHISNRFYEQYEEIGRASYLLEGRNALVDHSGAVMFDCGYYRNKDGWETRWQYPKEWYDKCQKHLKANKINHKTMINILANSNFTGVSDNCGHENATAPFYKKVFIMTASLDSNYHHLTADSLSRLPRYLQFLHANPDVYVHHRVWETHEPPQFRKSDKENLGAKKSREMLLHLLGIEPYRLITRSVIAGTVYIPREMTWSDALKNPAEPRLLAKELIKGSIKEIEKRVPYKLYTKSKDYASMFNPNSKQPTLRHQVDDPNYNETKARKNLVILIRKNKSAWGSRFWSDEMNRKVLELFNQSFPDHNIVPHFSDVIYHPQFCMACEILELTTADILVGLHGAGLTKQMFMPPGGLVFELSSHINAAQMPLCGYYGNWAFMFGHHHYFYGYDYDNGDGKREEMDPVDVVREARAYYDFLHSNVSATLRAPLTDPKRTLTSF